MSANCSRRYADDALRGVLRIQVQRGVDLQPLRVDRLQAEFPLQLAAHVHHKVGRFDGKGNRREAQLLARCQIGLLLRDVTLLDHQAQHDALAGAAAPGILQRVVRRRRLRQAGQQRALGQVEVGGALGEIGAGGGLDAVGQVAVVSFVQIKRQDFVFAVGARQPPGQDGLAQLALQADLSALLRREKQVAAPVAG